MKLLAITVLAILVCPAMADGNYTEDDLIEAMNIGFAAGASFASVTYTKTFYDVGVAYYSTLMEAVTRGNIAIREYNTFLEQRFNQTIIDRMKLAEFSL